MGEVVDILAVFPQSQPLIVVSAVILLAHPVRIADKERSYLVLHTELNHLAGRFHPAPFG
jgi:hypothetical protein